MKSIPINLEEERKIRLEQEEKQERTPRAHS
jgi:hypothetical protein